MDDRKATNWVITPDKFYNAAEQAKLGSYLAGISEKSIRGKVTRFIFKMLFETGLRASELCGLKIKDTPIVLGAPVLKVFGKGGKYGAVCISEHLQKEIETFVRDVRPKLLPRRIRRRDIDQPLLFSERRREMTRFALYKRTRSRAAKAGIPKRFHPHMGRHSLGMNMQRDFGDVLAIQSQLRHRSVATTQVYARAESEQLAGYMERVRRL